MILTFSRPEFKDKIISGTKTTTIRADKHRRWKVGSKIHFWMHNPRNVKKNPHCFAIGKVNKISYIEIEPTAEWIAIKDENDKIIDFLFFQSELDNFAKKEGFENWEDMKTFFTEPFTGRLIEFETHTLFF